MRPAPPQTGLAPFAIAWCGTMLAVHQLPRLPGAAWLIPAVILLLVAARGPARHWLLTAAAAAAWTVVCANARLDDRLPENLTRGDFDVRGWVDDFPSGNAERMTFSFRVEHAEDPAVPRRLRLAWYDAPDTLAPGAAFDLTVRLKAPRGLLNPGGFDYEQWLLVEGYGATGYVRASAAADDASSGPARRWLRMRHRIAERIAAAAPDAASAALLTALSIGERFGFTERQWKDLRRSGTSHLVAISGMHVGFIALLAFMAVRNVWLRLPAQAAHYALEAAACASLAAAAGYAALAGFGVPTQRSVIMVGAALCVAVSRRNVGAVNGFAAAMIIVSAWDPFAVLGASFWMSFGAVALLLWLGSQRALEARRRGAGRLWHHLGTLAILQFGISFGLIPVTAAFFGEFSAVSPMVNLIAIPFFTFVLVPAALLAALMSLVDMAAASYVVHAAGWLADGAWAAIHAAGGLSWAAFQIGVPAAGFAGLAMLGAAAGMPAHPLPGRRLAWCALLPVLWPAQQRLPHGAADVTVLDVGHGLAVIVETRAHRLLYDAGPRFPAGFDTGAEIVVPALAQRRSELDMVVVSHADNDHAGGVEAVLAAYPDAAVLKGPDVAEPPGRFCTADQRWTWDGVVFTVLHPPADFSRRGNESSCALKVATMHGSLLITGDAEANGERLLARRPDVAADVVIVGHHGSATSSRPAFVGATHARYALVSAGHANRWGFPRPEVVDRWRGVGAEVRVTAEEGALHVNFGANGIDVVGRRQLRRRYWRAGD